MSKVTFLLVDDALTETEVELDITPPKGWANHAEDDDQEWFETVAIPALRAAGHDPDLVEDWWQS